jgi:hypothetical protein
MARNEIKSARVIVGVFGAGLMCFVAKLLSGYVTKYGMTTAPLLGGKVRIWPLLSWSVWEGMVGGLAALLFIYVASRGLFANGVNREPHGNK